MLKRISIFWKLSIALIVIILIILLVLDYLNNLNSERYLQILFSVLLAIVLSCGLTWILVTFIIKRPFRKLIQGLDNLADKDFDFRFDENEKGDFSELSSSFNEMAAMLSATQTELDKTRDYLSSILESSADVIITVNPSGKILTFNMGAEKALNYKRSEVLGKPIEILFADPDDRKMAIERLENNDNVINYETQFLTKDGKLRDMLLTLSRLRNSSDAVIGTIGISKDITEEKRLQLQLMQSQRLAAIGQVFTSIQHSMKNMLNACKGGAYMVTLGLKKDNRKMLEEGWEMVEGGIARMIEMSSSMLKYVKEWKPRLNRVDISEILSDIYNLIKQTAADKGIDLQLNLSPDLPLVLCDDKMIHSAVMDIVSNALDACLWKDYDDIEKPKVAIGTYITENNQEIIIEIKDNGCGMTEDVKRNIFTPFFSTKSKAGTGLGLSITSRMINVHGGKIEVESKPDQGAIFRIMLLIDATGRIKENNNG